MCNNYYSHTLLHLHCNHRAPGEDKLHNGVDIICKLGRTLFNVSLLRSKRKTIPTLLVGFRCADDNSVSTLLEEDLQVILDVFTEAY